WVSLNRLASEPSPNQGAQTVAREKRRGASPQKRKAPASDLPGVNCQKVWSVLRLRLRLRIRRRSRAVLTLVSFSAWAAGTYRATTMPPALAHQFVELLALLGRNRLAHGQTEVDRGFLQRESRGADFLQLAIDRGAIWLISFEQVPQINPLHLKVCTLANFCLAEVRHLFANHACLFGGDSKLFPNGRVLQKACEAKFPLLPAETAPAHALASAEAISSMTPSTSLLTWAFVAHRAEPTLWPLLLGWRILWVALRQDRSGAKRHSQ